MYFHTSQNTFSHFPHRQRDDAIREPQNQNDPQTVHHPQTPRKKTRTLRYAFGNKTQLKENNINVRILISLSNFWSILTFSYYISCIYRMTEELRGNNRSFQNISRIRQQFSTAVRQEKLRTAVECLDPGNRLSALAENFGCLKMSEVYVTQCEISRSRRHPNHMPYSWFLYVRHNYSQVISSRKKSYVDSLKEDNYQ